MPGNFKHENREIPRLSQGTFFELWERSENASGGTADMHGRGKSDESIVPVNPMNHSGSEPLAESAEGRDSANGNAEQTTLPRTQSRFKCKSRGLFGVREAARNGSTLQFTCLLHHINHRMLYESFDALKQGAAAGVDGVVWGDYEVDLKANIEDLHSRIHRGAYRAKPTRRVWIPKPDGRQRPLGVTTVTGKSTPEQSAFGLR